MYARGWFMLMFGRSQRDFCKAIILQLKKYILNKQKENIPGETSGGSEDPN